MGAPYVDEATKALDRVARLDGYRVRCAADMRQREAWRGQFGVFRNGAIQYATERPENVRAWLYDQARRGARWAA